MLLFLSVLFNDISAKLPSCFLNLLLKSSFVCISESQDVSCWGCNANSTFLSTLLNWRCRVSFRGVEWMKWLKILMKIRSPSLMRILFRWSLPRGCSSTRKDNVVILLHGREINQLENFDRVIFRNWSNAMFPLVICKTILVTWLCSKIFRRILCWWCKCLWRFLRDFIREMMLSSWRTLSNSLLCVK